MGTVAGADAARGGLAAADRWRLHPRVALRRESFGGLLYHYGTRRLTFLKDARLVEVVAGLDEHTTVADACGAAGVRAEELPGFRAALGRLAEARMLVPAREAAR